MLARDPSPVARQEARDRSDSDWAETRPPVGRRGPSKRRQEAATDSATVDLVDWLSENPRTIEHIQEVGDVLSGPVIRELDKRFGGSTPRETRRHLTNHFWCDLLVALAEAVEKFSKAMDRIPEYVTMAITQSRKAERRGVLLEGLVALAVRTAWEPVKSMLHTTGIEELQRTCRILAVLICPAPENHKAVQDGALLPLAKEGMLETSRERLEQVFPAEWVRRLREGLGGA
ncbi:hypothetical protein [Planomonospora venezuelensis]|uniref:Uncharacterized protein n=1 Tax=Planomonospora venezuelensis TaxID=1999 RepID=A0A841CR90_PLAVE|nr:hypothetical protein [Planomonospora venezuelensis]MBB5960952.1 hypothetical protein [Planomonospora venezuelensis]